jgi:glycoside/pentoside/hexuronide:cation symporter, GPH family
VLSVASIAPGMRPGMVPETQLKVLGLGYAASLLTIWMLMIFCVSFYRISREGHEANLRALSEREQRLAGD